MSTDLIQRILKLKGKRNAIVLAHNYQTGDIQDMADFVGDSLDLSRKAAETDAEVIVFCGVHFMAETAAILSPEKKVLMPELRAGCPMADMITAEQLRAAKKKHPKALVLCYVNTSAAVKAESDFCCTSMNAVKIVRSQKDAKEILFVPDQFLGYWTSRQCQDRKFILWNGYCHIHVKILPVYIEELKKKHPKAEVLVHPECTPAVIDLADKVLGTGGMIKYAKETKSKEFIIGTENGLIHRLKKENPEKEFYPAAEHIVCPNMKLNTLEKILWCLEDMKNQVTVPKKIAGRARKAIERMLAVV